MAQIHARTGEVIPLQALGAGLAGRRTSALIKARQLELVRLVLMAGQQLREHSVVGEITVLCLEGEIELRTPAATRRLLTGDLVLLQPGEPHALLGVVDASALVTICLAAP